MSELYCLTRIKDQASSLLRRSYGWTEGWAEGKEQDGQDQDGADSALWYSGDKMPVKWLNGCWIPKFAMHDESSAVELIM
jgi:hypothetical protein